MLLYHFPLTSNSSTPNLTNKGLRQDYTINSNDFVAGGMISSFCLQGDVVDGHIHINNLNGGSICCRVKGDIVCRYALQGELRVIDDDKWHSYVLCDGKAYQDGAYLQDISAITMFDNCIDANGSLVQDIRIYDYALSLAEINEYSRAMVVHYPLQGNELNPNVLKDVSGFGNDYTLQGTNSYQLDSARGVKSLHTTDTAIYTQTPISSGYTTSFWCKYNGEWKHLCNNGSKYVDGVVNASQYDTIYATLTASGYDLVDYRVYATALSAEDIKNLYNSPVAVSNQHQTMAFEFNENPLYPSKYWHTPTYAEMKYILNTRTNAANLRTLGRVEVSSGVYRNGLFLLPDNWVLPSGVTMNITKVNYSTNSYTYEDYAKLEVNGAVFLPCSANRVGSNVSILVDNLQYKIGNPHGRLIASAQFNIIDTQILEAINQYSGWSVRLCRASSKPHSFSTSATTKIKFAKGNLQFHCIQHIWRFAEHSYDVIGAANANISDSYNGWIDLFGYGTSGVNYSPTLHTTNNADYASSNISNTDNDWGVNEIESYDYNVASNKLCKNGVVGHNEVSEGSANGLYANKLITNELIEN